MIGLDSKLFLKESYLGKQAGAEAYIVKKIGSIYGIRFRVTKGCAWCSGNLYHFSFLENELLEKFVVI